MFIHWGIYSILAGEGTNMMGECIQYLRNISKKDYEKLSSHFNPTEFTTNEWVTLAKSSGMKYLTFTTMHHDGFCMFDTEFTDYNSVNSPAKRDFVAELAS